MLFKAFGCFSLSNPNMPGSSEFLLAQMLTLFLWRFLQVHNIAFSDIFRGMLFPELIISVKMGKNNRINMTSSLIYTLKPKKLQITMWHIPKQKHPFQSKWELPILSKVAKILGIQDSLQHMVKKLEAMMVQSNERCNPEVSFNYTIQCLLETSSNGVPTTPRGKLFN